MKKRNRDRDIFAGLFLVLIILFIGGIRFLLSITEKNKLEEKLSLEYKPLTVEESVDNSIITTYYPEGWVGGGAIQFIKLDNGKSYEIWIKEYLTSDDVWFGNIVEPGVRLKKNLNSDTLTVITSKGEFKYLISGE